MITVYDLLEVDENASQEEIEKAYQRLLIEYHKDPKLSEEENNDREIILNKLKLAYDILSNEEKRMKYNKELAKKRAEELIKNVSVEKSDNTKSEELENISEKTQKAENDNVKQSVIEESSISNNKNKIIDNNESFDDENSLTENERKQLKKAAQKEFKNNLKKAQKAEEEYNKAYNEAYNDYLRKLGYTVKEPWTFKRVKRLILSIIIIIAIGILIWKIPFTRNMLNKIYEENIIIKSLVDIVVILFNAILGAFKI